MKIEFDKIEEKVFDQFKGGKKNTSLKMFMDNSVKIMYGKLEKGASIGFHKHELSSEIIFLLTGEAKVLYDDAVEILKAGECHYCAEGHSHSLINDSEKDISFFAVVPEIKINNI